MASYIQASIGFVLFLTLFVFIYPFNTKVVYSQPVVKDTKLKVELVAQGLKSPASMAFLGPNNILVTEKIEGTVKRIVNGKYCHNPFSKCLLQQRVKEVCWG